MKKKSHTKKDKQPEKIKTSKYTIQDLIDKNFFYYFCRIFPAIILLALFAAPFGITELDLTDIKFTGHLIFPFMLFTYFPEGSFYYYASFLIYFIPLNAIFSISTMWNKKKKRHKILHYTLNFLSLTILMFFIISCVILFANAPRWFIQVPWYVYLVTALTLILQTLMALFGMHMVRNSNPDYVEYKRILKDSKQKTKTSIKVKLIVSFTSTIAVILIIFMWLTLDSYERMFTVAVSEEGYSKAQQTASVYDSADGTREKILEFFSQMKESNKYSETPFERIDIIIPKVPILNVANLYMEQYISILPSFDVLAYTTNADALGNAYPIPTNEKSISADEALEIVRKFQNGTYRKSPIYNKKNNTARYFYPVTLTRPRGHLLQGFVVVTYKQELLMRSLFHAKIFVLALVLIFLYITVIITSIISDIITNPLLYLKANVISTSSRLSQILSGNTSVSAVNLNFDDSIKTHDEIKNLSIEIKDMVSLIKGVIPFISTSALKAAESENVKMSTSKDLCFLFTDIRGFTGICEGKKPKEVVDILNHYLEIETNIILKNNGEVDKFVGDEMMAFFDGPHKEYNACKAAMEIRLAMRREQQAASFLGADEISIGIGINTGNVVFGSVGSAVRRDFTSIGDVVNTAARLEGANKVYSTKALITEEVYKKLKDKFVCREIDFIKVKGKNKVCRIYEILQEKDSASEKLYEIKELFEKGLEFYRKQKWEKAEECFNENALKYGDMPSLVFMGRIAQFKETPPGKKWDGVFEMKVK